MHSHRIKLEIILFNTRKRSTSPTKIQTQTLTDNFTPSSTATKSQKELPLRLNGYKSINELSAFKPLKNVYSLLCSGGCEK
jgi:hypothetical protein